MSSTLLIDAAYLFTECNKRGWRADYTKLTRLLEAKTTQPFTSKVFFNGAFDNAEEKQGGFYDWLERNDYELQIRGIKPINVTCPSCRAFFKTDVQKGVDVAIATRLIESAIDSSCGQVILIAGDGDLHDAATYVAQRYQKKLFIVGIRGTVSNDLTRLAFDIIWLDDHRLSIEKTF